MNEIDSAVTDCLLRKQESGEALKLWKHIWAAHQDDPEDGIEELLDRLLAEKQKEGGT